MIRLLAVAAISSAVLSACVGEPAASPSPSTTAATRLTITDKTKPEIEAVLRARQQALARKDLKAFQATVDLARPAFRRCQQEDFDIASRIGAPADGPRVAKVEPYGDSYLRAYVEDGPSDLSRMYFRRDGDRWILTEPRIEELGGERSRTVFGVRIDYWGIDEDIVDIAARDAAETRDYIKPYANGPIKDPYSVKLIPTREAAGIVACIFTAFMNTLDEHSPFIAVRRLWLAPSLDRLSDGMRAILHHEGFHYLQDQFSHRITVRLDWWLVEGWPDYVARTSSLGAIEYSLCLANVPPLKRIIDGVPTEPDTPAELTAQFYALANTMVEYVYATYGPRTYWDLVALYKENTDYRVNYPQIFKVEPATFYERWLAYAKQKYC